MNTTSPAISSIRTRPNNLLPLKKPLRTRLSFLTFREKTRAIWVPFSNSPSPLSERPPTSHLQKDFRDLHSASVLSLVPSLRKVAFSSNGVGLHGPCSQFATIEPFGANGYFQRLRENTAVNNSKGQQETSLGSQSADFAYEQALEALIWGYAVSPGVSSESSFKLPLDQDSKLKKELNSELKYVYSMFRDGPTRGGLVDDVASGDLDWDSTSVLGVLEEIWREVVEEDETFC